MTSQTIQDAARYLTEGRMLSKAPVLFLGAGASVAAGIKPMRELMPLAFGCTTFEEFCVKIGPLTDSERFARLFEYLQNQGQDPFLVTQGYQALGRLIREMYFDLVLTTNIDPLLEDALVAAGLRRKHYLLLVNPVVERKWYQPLLSDPVPRVKIVKVHGDLFHRVMAWTPQEMESYLSPLGPKLEEAIAGRDMMVVGHSLADSPRIQKLAKKALANGRALWFVNIGSPPKEFAAMEHVRGVTGEPGKFEVFFTTLAGLIDAGAPPAAASTARVADTELPATLDDLTQSIVGVTTGEGVANATGFVVHEPRAIVTDGYFAGSIGLKDRATVIAADGRRFQAKVLRWVREYPFGPVILEAPRDLAAPGLRLEKQPPAKDLAVKVGVAAGTRMGISSGLLRNPAEQSLHIDPIPGKVGKLVQLECAVAPGACGAPVVDASFGVMGYIVAGSADLDNPVSYMHPSRRWIAHLKGLNPPSRRSRPRKRI